MTKETSNADIAVYLGAVFEHDSEERFLNRLRRDLARRGTNALILANFQARANNEQRQIDFLVLTDARLSHVELKALNPGAPVTGPLNGPWIQDLGGGRNSSIEPNPFFQAQNGTFAISDVAGRVMNSGKAPVSKPFFKQIDSVVCLDPGIPEGSTFERHTYVDVVGYNDLLTRIEAPGHRPPWLPEHWDAFIDALGIQKEEYFSPTERRRRESVEALAGYRQHFVERTTANLGAFVEIPFRFGEERMTFAESLEWIASGTSVGLIGKSGFGKSRAARECALVLTERERLVIWLDCGEYEKGDLRTLLSWSMAPFSTETPGRLAEHAGRIADQIVIVLDGFNECPPSLRGDLVTELDSFRLRFPSNLLVTSTVELPSGLVDEVLVAELPDAEQRASILASHGARDVDRVSEAFATPFELAVVALCDAELGPDATGAELYDAYVRQLAPSESIRSGMRALALSMVDEFRTSLRLGDAAAILGGASGLGLAPVEVDAVLGCRLLVVSQGHVRFSHELIGRFLAAEAVVFSAASSAELAEALAPAHRSELRWFALALERDNEHRGHAMAILANSDFYVSAVRGELGPAASHHATAAIRGVLADAAFAATSNEAHLEMPESEVGFFPRWTSTSSWSMNEMALLAAAGRLVAEGHFVDEVCELLDRTDEACLREMRAFGAAGNKIPVSSVLSAVVLRGGPGVDPLGATIVLSACETSSSWRRRGATAGTASRILAGAGRRSWCRLYAACLLCGPDSARADAELLPALLQAAWDAQGYHLQLRALRMAHDCGRSLDPEAQDRVAEILNSFETTHLFLQSSIVEALAAVDHLEALVPTVEQLADSIREVLATEESREVWRMAAGIISSQWEPEDIVGPYYAAVDSLTTDELLQLCMRAARDVQGVSRSWALEQLFYATPTDDADLDEQLRQIFFDAATGLPAPHGMIDENYDTHVYAVRGLARLEAPLPPPDEEWPGWHLVDQLIVDLESDGASSSQIWKRVMSDCPWGAIDALFELRFSGRMARVDRESDAEVTGRLFTQFPQEFRRLFEWGLQHLSDAPEPRVSPFGDTREAFMIRALGHVGDRSTAELLQPFLSMPGLTKDAVGAIRELNESQRP